MDGFLVAFLVGLSGGLANLLVDIPALWNYDWSNGIPSYNDLLWTPHRHLHTHEELESTDEIYACARTSELGVDLRRNILKKLWKITPAPIKTIFQVLRLNQLLEINKNKYDLELSFQRDWAEDFKQNRSKLLEYWRRYRYLDEIIRVCQITEDTRILDVGCGISSVLHYVNGKKFGIDPLADEYLKLYEYPEGINIKKGFGEEIPFTDEYFDVVFCSNVLDHVTDPKKTLNEIHRVLNPNGHFVLTVEIFKEIMKRGRAHPHSLTKRDVYSLLVDKFTIIFERESPWISLRRYYHGSTTASNKELVIISERRALVVI